MKWVIYSLFLIVLSGCSSTYSEKELANFDKTIQSYCDSLNLNMEKTANGLYYEIVNEGKGKNKIQYNDQVTFYYSGSFLDGNVFQQIPKENPLKFKVNQLIVGWQDVLMRVKEGAHIKIIIPPQLGYGEKETEFIPPNSIVFYDLTVSNVQ